MIVETYELITSLCHPILAAVETKHISTSLIRGVEHSFIVGASVVWGLN